MKNSNINVEFTLSGDGFNPNYITQKLSISPTRKGKKGDLIRNGKLHRKNDVWEISTDYQESYDTNEQLAQIINILTPKKDILKSLVKKYNIKAKFGIVMRIENGSAPGLNLDLATIKFANEIQAEFDVDIYVMS